MGICISKNRNNFLNKNYSDDIIIFTIYGTLNNDDYLSTIHFYEDYLSILNTFKNENISYYKIKNWGYNQFNNTWTFYKIERDNFLESNIFKLNMPYNEHDSTYVSNKLKQIINDHINFKNNL